jgi:hypothetical protein
MTVRRVRELRSRPDIYSPRIGSAYYMSNGNLLVNFGAQDDPEVPAVLMEFAPDGSTVLNQQLWLGGKRTLRYRAYPVDSIGGEQAVEPTPLIGN